MIDAVLLPVQRWLLAPPAHWLAARGVTADQVTLAGFGIGLGAIAALALLALNRLADGPDGTIARLRGPTDRGAFLDIALVSRCP